MIAACPRCSTRFRIGAERLRDEGVRLRCTQCQAVFRVYPPLASAPRRRDDPAVEAELTPPPRPMERERMVLVADPDSARGKASAAEIGRLGLHPLLVHDGVEALLALQRSLPARLLVDLSLPRLSGAELCEVVKRNESLRSIHIVAVGSAKAFAGLAALRAAGLGPDMLLEHADLPEGLSDALSLSRVEREEADLQPASALVPESVPSPEPEPAEPVAGLASAEPSPEIVRAERLARIVVSDIVLYNAERFERAAREGDVLDALAAELAEGRTLFRQRVPVEVCETRDFLAEELLRVARTRASR
jgi:predicted Zn finger-like uncharacterized protein